MPDSWDDPFNNYGRDGGCRPYQEPTPEHRDLLARPKPPLPLQVMRLHPDAQLPVRSTPGAAGLDLCSVENVAMPTGTRVLVHTGLAIAMPPGVYGRIASRSGLAVRCGIDVAAGVVDSDFRGEVRVLLCNNSGVHVDLAKGDRIAQLILESYVHFDAPLCWSESLPDSLRGANGYGSTGQ